MNSGKVALDPLPNLLPGSSLSWTLVALCLAGGIAGYFGLMSLGLDVATAQYYLAPLVLVVILLVLRGVHSPLLLGVLSAVGIGASSLWHFGAAATLLSPSIALLRLKDDPLAVETRLLEDRIHQYLKRGSSSYPVRVFVQEDSEPGFQDRFFAAHSKAPFLIHGTADLLTVWFREREFDALESLSSSVERHQWAEQQYPLGQLRLVGTPPPFQVPARPVSGTAEYLARLGTAVLTQSENSNSSLLGAAEIEYRSSASVYSPFPFSTHMAVAEYLLAASYLREAAGRKPPAAVDKGSLGCALDSFRFAAGKIGSGEVPLLKAALFNDWAVALSLKAVRAEKRAAVLKAEKLLVEAESLLGRLREDSFDAVHGQDYRTRLQSVISSNLKVLQLTIKQMRRERKKEGDTL